MKTVTLATFNTPAQAEPLRHRLEASHIRVWVRNGGMLKRLWFVHQPRAEVKLDVEPGDFRLSQQVMEDMRAGHAIKAAVRCPECGSLRVEYPQFTRKFFLPNMIGLLSGLGVVEKKYYCEDCHYTWSPDGPKLDRRTHMAPNYFLEGIPEKTKARRSRRNPLKNRKGKRVVL
jgi:hypothetical protein